MRARRLRQDRGEADGPEQRVDPAVLDQLKRAIADAEHSVDLFTDSVAAIITAVGYERAVATFYHFLLQKQSAEVSALMAAVAAARLARQRRSKRRLRALLSAALLVLPSEL
jgi:hypothetical protein